jgi:hypothetical protein
MTSLVTQNKQRILDRLSKGELLTDIAKDYGLTGQAISNRLSDDPEYKAAREASLECRMDNKERDLEVLALDPDVSLARIAIQRELLSHARWRAERECKARWGKESQVININTNASVESLLSNRAADLLNSISPAMDAIESKQPGEREPDSE